MKFEEVLPKMRDEGRVGMVGTTFFKMSPDGKLWAKVDPGYWEVHHNLNEEYLTTDEWSIEPRKVKRWAWAFGHGDKCQMVPHNKMTEIEAECYKITHDHEWMERIEHTMVEEEE